MPPLHGNSIAFCTEPFATMDKPRIVAVIPSRYGAQRLPGKPLIKLLGKPMIQWVYEAAKAVPEFDEVLVATDDDRIREAVEGFGGTAVMTPESCVSGTDRVREAVVGRTADIVVNVQGDEPGMHPDTIRTAVLPLLEKKWPDVSTACLPIHDREEFEAVHVVKVVRADNDRALYFSRSPIPSLGRVEESEYNADGYLFGYKHLGLYVYRREALESFVRFPPSPLELREKLEQLRFMEFGASIACPVTQHDSIGVDVEADIPKAEELLRRVKAKR